MTQARLLDLTRLVSRLGRGPHTGVDRVEFAYLDRILSDPVQCFGLVRTAVGYILLDRAGMAALHRGAVDLSKRDLIGKLAYRNNPLRARAEAGVRRLATGRCTRIGLRRMILRHLLEGGSYLSVGHANLDSRTLAQIKAAGLKTVILVHDTIPLDFPQFTRPDTLAAFRRKIEAVSRFADVVIHSTQDARSKTEAHFTRAGRVPPGLVANLGVTLADPRPLLFKPRAPYFVCLGTIEPRKNHALLLDVWERLPAPRPSLYIIGGRGWSNVAVFNRLDRLAPDSAVEELHGLSDGEVVTLLAGAHGLLFPSFAEGFGLPAIEAAALGTPVFASNLTVFEELLGNSAVYLDPNDSYSWLETIKRQSVLPKVKQSPKIPASWKEHFNYIFSKL